MPHSVWGKSSHDPRDAKACSKSFCVERIEVRWLTRTSHFRNDEDQTEIVNGERYKRMKTCDFSNTVKHRVQR